MNLKTRYVVVSYNPTTKEIQSVFLNEKDLTAEQAKQCCEDLNPVDARFVRCRVGVLVTEEES